MCSIASVRTTVNGIRSGNYAFVRSLLCEQSLPPAQALARRGSPTQLRTVYSTKLPATLDSRVALQ